MYVCIVTMCWWWADGQQIFTPNEEIRTSIEWKSKTDQSPGWWKNHVGVGTGKCVERLPYHMVYNTSF